mgnify:CR=1 FL=1
MGNETDDFSRAFGLQKNGIVNKGLAGENTVINKNAGFVFYISHYFHFFVNYRGYLIPMFHNLGEADA